MAKAREERIEELEKRIAALEGRVPEQLETNKLLQKILGQLQRTNLFLQIFAKYFFSQDAYQELLKSLKEAESGHNRLVCTDESELRQYDSQT